MGDLLEISQPSYSDKLQVFYCPPTEAAVQSVEWIDVRPIVDRASSIAQRDRVQFIGKLGFLRGFTKY